VRTLCAVRQTVQRVATNLLVAHPGDYDAVLG
jgi:hypothetical protein